MALDGATPVLRQDMTMNPGASMSSFTALPIPSPTPRPQYQPVWEQHPLPLMASSCPPSIPLGLAVFPKPLLVTGVGGPGPNGAVTGNVIFQVRAEGELPVPQTFVVTQTPLNWTTPGTASGTVLNVPPPFVAASVMEQMMPATSVVGTQISRGSLYPSLQVPPLSTQLASIFPQVKSRSGLHSSSREQGLATTQSRPSLDDSSCNSKSVYENYRLWQRFKPLARRHHPQSPDTEALSCFLIPVMRSLAQLKPTMTLEEGLWRSVQEWQRKSNFDRMIYYEMAGKFMEFESEEEMQIQKLQQRNGLAHLPPPVPQKFHPPKASDTVTGQHPVFILKKGSANTQPHNKQPHRSQCPWEPKAPKKIPPEAMKEYAEIMEDLLGLAYSATGEPNGKHKEENEQHQEEHDIYPDPGLLNYIDKLCSQEAFVTKVEAVIHPQFLEMLLSPESQADPLSLTQELEQEEGLTLSQLIEKRLLKLKGEESVEALPESKAIQDAGSRDNHNLHLSINKETSTKNSNVDGMPKDDRGSSNLSKSKERALFRWSQKSQKLKFGQSTSPLQGHGHISPRLGTRNASMFIETSTSKASVVGEGYNDEEELEEEELPSLAFLLKSQESLLPWGLSKSPLPVSSILHHGVQCSCPASQHPYPGAGCLCQPQHAATKSKLTAHIRTPSLATKRTHSETDRGISGRQLLDVNEDKTLLPIKRKCDLCIHGNKKKCHFSQ